MASSERSAAVAIVSRVIHVVVFVSRVVRAYVGELHVAAGGMTSSSVGVGGVARVYPSFLSPVIVVRCLQLRRASCCSRDKV